MKNFNNIDDFFSSINLWIGWFHSIPHWGRLLQKLWAANCWRNFALNILPNPTEIVPYPQVVADLWVHCKQHDWSSQSTQCQTGQSRQHFTPLVTLAELHEHSPMPLIHLTLCGCASFSVGRQWTKLSGNKIKEHLIIMGYRHSL